MHGNSSQSDSDQLVTQKDHRRRCQLGHLLADLLGYVCEPKLLGHPRTGILTGSLTGSFTGNLAAASGPAGQARQTDLPGEVAHADQALVLPLRVRGASPKPRANMCHNSP